MVFFLFLWWTALFWVFHPLWPHAKEVALYAGAGIFILYQLFCHRSQLKFRPQLFYLFLLLYLLAILLSSLRPQLSYYVVLLEASRLFLCGALVWAFSKLKAEQYTLLMAYSLTQVVLMVLLGWVDLNVVDFYPLPKPTLFPIGQVTYYGDFMALHIPFGLYLFFQFLESPPSLSRRLKLFGVSLALVFVLLGLWIAAPRASLLGLAFAGVTVLFLHRSSLKPHLKKIFYAGLAFPFLLVFFHLIQPESARVMDKNDRIHPLTYLFSLTQSDQPKDQFVEGVSKGRTIIYRHTWQMIQDRPFFGWGLDHFVYEYPSYLRREKGQPFLRYPHNILLQQWVELGPLGLLAFVLLAAYPLARAVYLYPQLDAVRKRLLVLAFSGFVISLTSWQFSTNFRFSTSCFLTLFYLGLFLKIYSELPQSQSSLFSFSPKFWMLFWSLLTVFAIGITQRQLLAEFLCLKGLQAPSRQEARAWFEDAYALVPWHFDILNLYAGLCLKEGDLVAARPALARLVQNYPRHPQTLYRRAQSLQQEGRLEEARVLIQEVLKIDPLHERARGFLQKKSL